jgi:predicted RNA-binding Zn-ribbon protein involved in translation (DUF1610 family)
MEVAMKRFSGAAMTGAGVLLILLGLLFLVGAGGQTRRVVIGLVGLALGGVMAGSGVRLFKLADAESPEQLRAEILDLARRRNGEVAEDDLAAALGRRLDAARRVLDDLVRDGTCQQRNQGGSIFYIFKDLQPRLAHLVCDYCGAELPISADTDQCPSCGGTIKTRVARHGLSGDDYFAMDVEE